MDEIEQRSGGVWRPSPTSVYPGVARLREDGLVVRRDVEGRHIFELSEAGPARVVALAKDPGPPWQRMRAGIPDGAPDLHASLERLASAVMEVQWPAASRPRARSGRSPRSTLTAASRGPASSSPRRPGPTAEQTSALARRVAAELQAAGCSSSASSPTTAVEFGRRQFTKRLPEGAAHTRIRAGRPQTNGHVERLHRTILEECWRPAFVRYLQVRFSVLRRDLASYLHDHNYDREHHGRSTTARARPTSSTVPARWSRDEPHLSAQLGVCSH